MSAYRPQAGIGMRHNRIVRTQNRCDSSVRPAEPPRDERAAQRPDIVFENWDRETYEGWTVTGNAFGTGPVLKSKMPAYQGDVGGPGKRVANSHATAPGNDVGEKDNQLGTLTSREFTIERDYIKFWIGGGGHTGTTCLNLLVDGKSVLTATGHNNNRCGSISLMSPSAGTDRPLADRRQPDRAVGEYRRGRDRA